MAGHIVVERTLRASPADAFAAWTDPERLAEWWWPHLPDTVYEIDARVGGGYRIWSEAVGIGAHGEYTAIDAPERLAFTWVWDGEGGHPPEPVVVTFVPQGGGSKVVLDHDCGADPDGLADLSQGWTDVLDRLAALPADPSA